MSWHARLELDYQRRSDRTILHHRHEGPLRVLKSLYPEGPVCHNVLVHPPGGLVGGDTLDIRVRAEAGAHALITTPGATRFYRSLGEEARQQTRIELAAGSRLEWLPLETIAYHQCRARNSLRVQLAPGAELLGWEVCALGLPHAGQPFDAGEITQHLELEGAWLERGRIAASDHRLLQSPLGLDGQRCLGSLFLLAGSAFSRARRELALDLAREAAEGHPLAARAGATSPHGQVLVLRVLGPQVEPVMALLRRVWSLWREQLWDLTAEAPRIWAL
ncbi:MAG: urease accessory protein UreD [Curvibacter sp.]|nr:urease accessory protein UreD [Curvibacter sp.]